MRIAAGSRRSRRIFFGAEACRFDLMLRSLRGEATHGNPEKRGLRVESLLGEIYLRNRM